MKKLWQNNFSSKKRRFEISLSFFKSNPSAFQKYIFGIFVFLCCQACTYNRGRIRPFVKDSHTVITRKKTDAKTEKMLSLLTSSNFYEYTQAARYFIDKGPSAIPLLYQNRHLLREVSDSVVPVCLLVVRRIFEKQKIAWVRKQLLSPFPEICTIALEEIERRKSEKKKVD